MNRSDIRRLPSWLRLPAQKPGKLGEIRRTIRELKLATVCEGARCPNRGECFYSGTATFMILGKSCSRECRFCSVPHKSPEVPEPDEPQRVAEAVRRLRLSYVVVTSVTRDDLPDGGAGQFAKTVEALRSLEPSPGVEVLVPDFQGKESSIEIVLSSHPDVLTHNLETVPRLYPTVRPGALYDRSLDLLRRSAASGLTIKTGLMLGLGETEEELEKVYRDVTEVGCKILTLGQYLQPTWKQLPVARYWRPEEFEEQKARARRIGIPTVAAGPLVRSSYLAGTLLQEATMRISVVGRNFDANGAVHRYLEERLAKIRRHFDRLMDVSVVLNTEKHRHRAEININVNNVNMRGEEETQDMYTSIDQAVDKIDRQIRRYKDKLNSRKHQHRYTPVNESELPTVTHELLEPNAGEVEEYERRVIKTERHMVKPMNLDEAVMQMDLNNADFYVFSNANSDKINVVYRRLDGNVGWIVPD